MSSHHDDVDEFWGGQRDWTDSHPRQRNSGRTSLGQRLKTGVQSVFDAGATASRAHGETGSTPLSEPLSGVAGDLDFDLTPRRPAVRRTGDGLSIGELAQPYEPNVQEATQPVPRVSVGVVTPPSNHSVDAGERDVVADPEPSVTRDYSGLAVETDAWDDDWDTAGPVDTARGGVDPLLAKFGMLAVVITLVAGFFVSTRGDGPDDSVASADAATTLAANPTLTAGKQASGNATRSQQADDNGAAGGATATASRATESADVAGKAVPVATQAAEVECGAEYEVVEGDYWLRLADGSGVSLNELLSANGAGTDTPLYPGATICLPEGAVTPPPPPAPSTAAPVEDEPETAAASDEGGSSDGSASSDGSSGSTASDSGSSDTKAPATTAPATTAAPTTQAPATTAPATTAPSTTQAPATAAEVEAIIREIFPADQVDKALAVAWRESSHRPDVYNGWCCYGLFQIYYTVHQDWLRDFGVNQASDLYDARKNTVVAYELYKRSGGWGPWGG